METLHDAASDVGNVCAVGWTAGSGSAFAQNTSRVESVKTDDGMGIRFTYYPRLKDKGTPQDAPVAILLHGAGGSRIVWDKGRPRPAASRFRRRFRTPVSPS